MLIGARVLQGVGAALLTPPTLAIINHTFLRWPQARGTAIGIWGAVAALAFAIGPVLGGLITTISIGAGSSSSTFPFGLAGLLVGARLIPESVDPGASSATRLPGPSSRPPVSPA